MDQQFLRICSKQEDTELNVKNEDKDQEQDLKPTKKVNVFLTVQTKEERRVGH